MFTFPGPISSSLVNRWGCQAVTVAGAFLSAICIIVSAYAQNVITLIFTIGVGAGFGFGLIYLPAIVSVTVWFERYRSLATGIVAFFNSIKHINNINNFLHSTSCGEKWNSVINNNYFVGESITFVLNNMNEIIVFPHTIQLITNSKFICTIFDDFRLLLM